MISKSAIDMDQNMCFLPKSQKVLTIRHEIKSTVERETTRGCVIVTYFSHKMTVETISVLLSDNAYGGHEIAF